MVVGLLVLVCNIFLMILDLIQIRFIRIDFMVFLLDTSVYIWLYINKSVDLNLLSTLSTQPLSDTWTCTVMVVCL